MVEPYESENHWRPRHAGADILEWVDIPGTNPLVQMQYMKGWPSIILRAYAADYNAYIEPLRNDDSASFTPTNSVDTSNHLNGTAQDLNWNSHPFRVANAGYSPEMIRRMRELLDFYTYKGVQIVWWANDWDDPKDAMHHQMGYETWNNPLVGDFIRERIRPDGFSTFKRGGEVAPPGVTDEADVLARATGISHTKALEILPTVQQGLRLSDCNNVNRIAMWLAQMGHESAGFVYTEEIQSGDENADRWKYKGRTWIQITWESNYRDFSAWCFHNGLVPSPTEFVDNPKSLADLKWAGIGPAWYWTVQRSDTNALSDRRDIELVSRRINGTNPDTGRANGIQNRIDRFNRALSVGDQLLGLIGSGEDELSAEAEAAIARIEQKINALDAEYSGARRAPDRSFFAKDQSWGESPLGYEWNINGNVNELYMTWGYLLGVSSIEDDVEYIAEHGVAPASWAGSLVDDAGKKWLAEIGQQWCKGLVSLRAAMQKAFRAGNQPSPAVNKSLTLNAEPPQVVYVPAPEAPVRDTAVGGSTGQIIGQAYDALEALQLSGALDDTEKAPLAALIAVLQTKTEGQPA